jgi:hypothetical protein
MRANLYTFGWFSLVAVVSLVLSGQYACQVANAGDTSFGQLDRAEYLATSWFWAFAVSAAVSTMLLARIAHEWVHDHVLHRNARRYVEG